MQLVNKLAGERAAFKIVVPFDAHVQREFNRLRPLPVVDGLFETDEGHAWHLIQVRSFDKSYPACHGNGNGGQLLLVVPQFDLAVLFAAPSH
ncbi:MAG: hypothetical protein AB7F36_16905 [Reyranellaceae bacterium]